MKVLVTGACGFVGHAVVRAAVERGHAVVAYDLGTPHPRWPGGIELVRGDVRDAAALARAARGTDLLVHVAGIWDGSAGGEARMRTVNVDGTRNALAAGPPVVYTSSSITCGYGPLSRPGTEDEPSEDPEHPIRGTGRVYRKSKLQAEELVGEAGGWIVNPDYVVGAGDVHGVVTGPLLRVASLPIVPVPRGGKCFVGVDDVGIGHWLVFERGSPARRYLLGAENRSYVDVLAVLAQAMGRTPRLVRLPHRVPGVLLRLPVLGQTAGALEQMSLERYRDSSRARQELGWTPGSVDAALHATVAFAEAYRF